MTLKKAKTIAKKIARYSLMNAANATAKQKKILIKNQIFQRRIALNLIRINANMVAIKIPNTNWI